MKIYLYFKTDGDIEEIKINLKTKNDIFSSEINDSYSNNTIIEIKNNKFLIFFNNNNNNNLNLCKFYFIDFEIFSNYIIFKLDNNDCILNFTKKQLIKIIDSKFKNQEIEYSSDDFD